MSRIASIHGMYAADDIITDLGWDGIYLHVAIDPITDRVLFVHLDEVVVQDWCESEGWTPVPYHKCYDNDNGKRRWTRCINTEGSLVRHFADERAADLRVGDVVDDDGQFTIASVDTWGDTILVLTAEEVKLTFDCDETVLVIARRKEVAA